MKKFKQLIAMLLASITFISTTVPVEITAESDLDAFSDVLDETLLYEDENSYGYTGIISYYDYLQKHNSANHPNQLIEIKASSYLSQKEADAKICSYNGRDEVLYWDSQQGTVSWEFDVAEEGFYNMYIDYCPIQLKNGAIQLGILLDGEIPFANAKTITLPRLYLDESYKGYQDWRCT